MVQVSFVCSVCLSPADSEVKSIVDVGDGSGVEIVDEFCYPGDMLSVYGDDDAAAVTARICSGWFKFRSLPTFSLPKMCSCCCEEELVSQSVRHDSI